MERIGPYKLVKEIARGGMGAVFKALDPAGRPVAVKLLLAGRSATAAQRKRFAFEAEALARVQHPGVVPLLEAGEAGASSHGAAGAPWLALEWIEGESLAERLDRAGPLEPEEAAELVRRLALAIAHCHAQGVLHRDLKPENVLLRRDGGGLLEGIGEPLLTDFGLARALDQPGPAALTRTGVLLGTPHYWSPEQASGDPRAIGTWTDVYGLGALLYAALTGQSPLQGGSIPEVLAQLQDAPTPPSRICPRTPRALEDLCVRAMARSPGERPGSAELMAADLQAWLDGHGGAGSVRRDPRPLAAGILVVGASAAAALFLFVPPAPPESPVTATAPPTPLPPPPPPPLPPPPPPPVAEDPDGPAVYLARAQALLARKDVDGALRELDALVASWPRDARGRIRRAQLLYERDRGAEAKADLDLVLERDPEHYQARIDRGVVRAGLGELEGAIADWQAAAAIRPEMSRPYALLAITWVSVGETEQAHQAIDRGLQRDPRDLELLHIRGMLRVQERDAAGAKADLDQVLAARPGDTVARVGRGEARRLLGDLAGARQDLDAGLAEEVNPLGLASRGAVKLEQGDAAGALEDSQAALAMDPASWLARATRGQLREAQQDWKNALADYDASLAGPFRDPQTLARRGSLRMRLGDFKGALADMEEMLATAPDHPAAAALREQLPLLRQLAGTKE